MKPKKEKINDLFEFQFTRRINSLSKRFLETLEDLRAMGFHFDYESLRKRILDTNGETVRELVSYIDKFDIRFKDYEDSENQK